MKSLKYYFKKAQKEHWAMGQFNFSAFEQMRAVFKTAKREKSPAILGTSEGEAKFFGLKQAVALKELFKHDFRVPVFLNLDHGKDIGVIREAMEIGYDAVHFDGSALDFDDNIRKTREVVSHAKKRKVLVEGELGIIKGQSIEHKGTPLVDKNGLTSLKEVEIFIKETGVDLLAISIGNIHGVYSEMPGLDFERLSKIRKKTDTFLVLHGASGIKKEDLEKAIRKGIVKVNINTELRKDWKEAFKKALSLKEMKPYNIIPKVEDSLIEKVSSKMAVLKSKNKII